MPLLSLPTWAGAGTCPGDLKSFCMPLPLSCVQHMGHLHSVPAKARARIIHLLCSRSQGGGKSPLRKSLCKKQLYPEAEIKTPVQNPACLSMPVTLGLRRTLLGTAGSSGALPGWLLAVQFVHVAPGLHKG